MATNPEHEWAPGNQSPAAEPGKPARELTEDDLKQVAGGDDLTKNSAKVADAKAAAVDAYLRS